MEKWGLRLKETREKYNLSQYDLSRKMEKDVTQISRYERGGTKSLTRALKKILLNIFDVEDVEYIETGKRNNSSSSFSIVQEGSGHVAIQGGGNSVGSSRHRESLSVKEEESVVLPYYPDGYVQSGSCAYPYLKESVSVCFSKSFLTLHLGLSEYKNIFILNTTGESMEPTLKNGSLIFVNPFANEESVVRDGGIYVIVCDDVIVVKRVSVNPITKAYTLVSDHPQHENIVIDSFSESRCRFVGRVVGSFDRV